MEMKPCGIHNMVVTITWHMHQKNEIEVESLIALANNQVRTRTTSMIHNPRKRPYTNEHDR
jgi:hypothetical protein